MKKPAHETRQHILDVTRALMTRKGYTAVGLAEVVAAAGVPKGSFYYYFKSKEEFGLALLDEYFSAYLATVDRLLTAEGAGAECLVAYFQYWKDSQGSDFPDDKCLVVKLGPEMCDLSEDMRTVLRRGTDAIIQRITRCAARGQTDGSPNPRTSPGSAPRRGPSSTTPRPRSTPHWPRHAPCCRDLVLPNY
jgi:TetR/AcrR family transcriptional repressor of nem operon